ncbi:MAG: hypothetical protein E7666_06370 [Ruminococcaceae bacterium]|nr:hypothetical protein [Oscillospiraceae bacterium]
MKKVNLKKVFTRSSLVWLILALLMPMILTASAETLTWELSGDEVTLTHGDEIYTAFSLPVDSRLRPRTRYVYAETVDIFSYYDPNPESYEANGDIVWLDLSARILYVTREGGSKLVSLRRGQSEKFYLANANLTTDAPIKKTTVNRLNDLVARESGGIEVDVNSGLEFVTRYELLAYDDTETVCQFYGVIYEIEGTFYYLNYQKLDNKHFDADGKFSYRSGTVTLYPIGAGTEQTLRDVMESMTPYRAEVSFEEGEELIADADSYNPAVFWFMYIAIGFMLPCLPLILGLILPHLIKWRKPTYWYSVAIAAGVWILSAIVILILLL